MLEEKTVVPPTENEVGDDTPRETEPKPIDEGGKKLATDVIKKEGEDEYAKKLNELNDELIKKDEIIAHKNRAIKALKKKSDDIVDETLEVLEDDNEPVKQVDFRNFLLNEKLSKLTSNANEQKLIRHHLENSIKKTGDLNKDIENAWALANSHLAREAYQHKSEVEQKEASMTHFSSGEARGQVGRPAYETDAIKRSAALILDKVDPEAKKYL